MKLLNDTAVAISMHGCMFVSMSKTQLDTTPPISVRVCAPVCFIVSGSVIQSVCLRMSVFFILFAVRSLDCRALSFYLHFFRCVCLSVCVSACVSACLIGWLIGWLIGCLFSVSLSDCLFACLFVCLPFWRSFLPSSLLEAGGRTEPCLTDGWH